MGGHHGLLSAVCCVFAASCAGKSLQDEPHGSAASAGGGSGGASNGALTPEIHDTGIPLDAVLGQLDAPSQRALCGAYGAWRFRLREGFCNAFVESAVVLMPHTTQEARQLCADSLSICRVPSEPTSACTGFAAGCAVTVAEFDRCVVDEERWLDAVPTCENFTYEAAPSVPGPSPDSCRTFNATCQAL